MKKVISIVVGIIIGAIIILSITSFYAQKSLENREIVIGVQENSSEDIVYGKPIISQDIIDNIDIVYISGKTIEKPNDINTSRPDAYIRINNPQKGTMLIDSKVWIKENDVIIAIGDGDNTQYKSVPNDGYIKEIIDNNKIS